MLSVGAKKKERVGEFKNSGRTWRPKGTPSEVNIYDYPGLGGRSGNPVRSLRCASQPRIRECGDGPRECGVRSRELASIVAPDGTAPLQGGEGMADLHRWRREQREPSSGG